MNEDVENQEPFPDLDAAGALRAAFKSRAGSSRSSARIAAHAPRQGYELQGEIARGGMGVVVKAFDRDLTRDVALKVLRDELADEPRFVRRFLEEARVTARLDHPGIVPVHEVGRDSSGRAYFAMRLVRGRELRRIIELANSNQDGWSQARALSVLLKVCEAMAYAHDKGVVHRDLKPSNVMVGEFGEVYVMDWGLARVLGHDDAHDLRLRAEPEDPAHSRERRTAELAGIDSPIVTMDGEVLGTPCYMSPEQARGSVAEIGPHSDVYAVGAMLYHLLAGEMPYVPAGTSVASRTVLAHLAQGPPRSLHELHRDLPAELIAICERAMARAPAQRYASMLAFAEDLRAFLERRVVSAFETGAFAEAKMWVRRNRPLASALAAIVLALVVGLFVSLSLKAKSDANYARAEASAQAANAEREKTEKFANFLEDTLRGVTPSAAAGRDTTMLREMMDVAWWRIEHGELASAPEAELRLAIVVGGAYRDVAEYDKADPILRRALKQAEGSPDTDPDLLARSLSALGTLLDLRGDSAHAETLCRRALEINRRIFVGDHARVAQSLENLAAVLKTRGDLPAAEALLRQALEMHERLYPDDDRAVALNLHNLAVVLEARGEYAAAEAIQRRALEMQERLYPGDHPEVAGGIDGLGAIARELGDLAGAEALHRRALEMRRRLFASDHPEVAVSLNNLGTALGSRGDFAGAEALYREALEMQRRLFKGDHADLAQAISNLAAMLHSRGDLAGAEPLYSEALAMQRRLFPGDHPGTPVHLHNLAQLLRARDDLAGAESLLREALAMQRRVVEGDHPDTARIEESLAFVLRSQGDLAGAEPLYRDVLEMRTRIYAGDHLDVAKAMFSVARALEERGDFAASEPRYRGALEMYRALHAESEWRAAQAALGLGRVLSKQKRFGAADEALRDAMQMREGGSADDLTTCVELLVANCTDWDQAEPNQGHAEQAADWKQQLVTREQR